MANQNYTVENFNNNTNVNDAMDLHDELSKLFDQASSLACMFADEDFFEWSLDIKINSLWALKDIIEKASSINEKIYEDYASLHEMVKELKNKQVA